jgi:membrane protease YdiL (CAAX protease family)
MRLSLSFPKAAALLAAIILSCAIVAWRVLPIALPTIALDNRLAPASAEATARAFLAEQGFAVPDAARAALNFSQQGEWQTYLELEAGGKPALDTAVQRGDVPLFEWNVRFFTPGDPREITVTLAPDGRVVGFDRTLAEGDRRAALDSASALDRAVALRDGALYREGAAWTLVSSSLAIVPGSERRDRSFSFERSDTRFGDAPIRLDVTVQGDSAARARLYPVIPETFQRRYGEMRSANELYAGAASAVIPVFAIFVILALVRGGRQRALRWRPALVLGSVIGGAAALAGLNTIGLSWYFFDTATDPTTHVGQQVLLGAVLAGGLLGGASTLLLAAGEYLTRQAFPQHYDWWHTARDAGLRPVALRIGAGYAMAAFGLAYVGLFYVLVQRVFGWWSPTSLLDDPNLIATPFPWLSALAISLQAGILEEVLFRAVPLAVLSRWVGDRPSRPWVMALGVVFTALVFGFAHANYASWPAYARGVELFAESVLWGWLFLRFGLPVTVIGHFLYDLLLFGLFAAAGTDAAYRVTLAVLVLLIIAPAVWTLWKLSQRAASEPEPADARFAGFTVPVSDEPEPDAAPVAQAVATLDPALRKRALLIAGVGVVVAAVSLARPVRGPVLSVDRAQATAAAESLWQSQGRTEAAWTVLTLTGSETRSDVRQYLKASPPMDDAARTLFDATWRPPTLWQVRAVRTDDDVALRAESWRVTLRGDGQVLGWSHVIADTATVDAASREESRAAALAALVPLGADTTQLREVDAAETKHPNRLDVRFRFDDLRVALPGEAAARWVVTVSGSTVLEVGRSVFLPEDWEREVRGFDGRRALVLGVVFLLLGVVVLRGVVTQLRAPVTQDDAPLWAGRVVPLVLGLIVVELALYFNGWRGELYGYDTAVPWSSHQFQLLLGATFALAGGGLLIGGCAFAEAVRRRVGVAVRATREATLHTGLAIAGALLTVGGVQRLLSVSGERLPSLAGTDAFVPALSSVNEVYGTPVTYVIAAAVLASIVHARRDVLVLIALAAVVSGLGDATGWSDAPLRIALAAGGFGLLAWLVRPYARVSFTSWLLAGLFTVVADGVLRGVTASTATSAVVALVPAVVAGVVVVLWLRSLANAPGAAPPR